MSLFSTFTSRLCSLRIRWCASWKMHETWATHESDRTAEDRIARQRGINEAGDLVPGSQDSLTRRVQTLQPSDTPATQTALQLQHHSQCPACCGDSISEVLEKLHSIRTEATSLPQDGSSCCVPHRVLFDSHARICITLGFALSPFLCASILFFRRGNGKPNYECLYCVGFW